ncbi:MAG: NAD-glutamate dehydrogenase domain-containing protein, partial [Gammaproteobacteria bacterium]
AAGTRLDEDRILRGFRNAVTHTLRTNHFQRDVAGGPKAWLSFKLDAARCPDLPLPRPQFEIFVYSPRVEGVHLRKGPVARGGLRWSDRREDFRTEVLGLMKAQNVKNAVIVPVGAKGGFYCKQLPVEREAMQREGIACYQTFIRGMLDLTDNRIDGGIRPPPDVVRLDGDDPYLVVAADKGTASFSDIANAISLEYGHWLGDAFASGGSAGYDHKRMGITARGAWESVKRHFRELGLDPQSQAFTCVGIGDMAGDVFGNGMLQSPHLRLLAAFNHQHIFLDPEADAARGHAERARLFALPRSSWDDYDRAALGPGGAIHLRTAKSLPLSPEAQRLLGLPAGATPNEVIRAILRLPVDLLWNGGIGTYVKASTETHLSVGDRANDAVRVDGQEVRARVIGEGGNLGMTQRGRVEFALHGGRLNTDFIDNSAGVNCSDVEVNNKILLGQAMAQGRLRLGERNKLLARMTDEVAGLVLRNNVQQAQTLSVMEGESQLRGREHLDFIHFLEGRGELDRAIESLPDDATLQSRWQSGRGLTRPELAVLLSYGKLWLFQQLIDSAVPEDPFLAAELLRYFPGPVRRRHAELAAVHPLRREIVATTVANTVVNRGGPTVIHRLAAQTGVTPAEATLAWTIGHELLSLGTLWPAIEALDPAIPAAASLDLLARVARHLRHAAHWVLLQRRHAAGITPAVSALRPALANFLAVAPGLLTPAAAERHASRLARHATAGVPVRLAEQVAALEFTIPGLHVAALVGQTGAPAPLLAELYLGVGGTLGFDWLQDGIESLRVAGHWPALARVNLREQAYETQAAFAARVLALPGATAAARLAAFGQRHAAALAQLQRTQEDIRAAGAADFATLSVALQAIRRVV